MPRNNKDMIEQLFQFNPGQSIDFSRQLVESAFKSEVITKQEAKELWLDFKLQPKFLQDD